MNFNVRFICVFVSVCVGIQDLADGAAVYRRQTVNPDHYLDSPRGQTTDFDDRSEFALVDDSYGLEPDVARVKDIRNKPSADEIIRQARRERNRVLLGGTTARRPSVENTVDDSEVDTRGGTRYGAKYGRTGDDAVNPRSRPSLTPVLDYDDSDDGATTSRVAGYNKYAYKRLENKTPESLREPYTNTDLKYKLGNVNGPSKSSDEVESNDLKTLSLIIKKLKSEKLALDKPSNLAEDTRRVGSFAKEREEAKVRPNSGGLQRTDIKLQGNTNLDDYLITRTNALKTRNGDQGTGHTETGISAKEHVLRLLGELEKLEEIKRLQRVLDAEGDYPQYDQLKQELSEDLKIIRNKVRQAIRELQ